MSEVAPIDPDIKELAFVCFIEADRNVSRAHRLLCARLMEDEVCPDRSTLSRWASKEQWNLKADEEIARNFPGLTNRMLARLISLRERAIETHAAILAGEMNDVRAAQLQALTNVSTFHLQMGFGNTLGAKGENPGARAPELPQQLAEETKAISPAEAAERQR